MAIEVGDRISITDAFKLAIFEAEKGKGFVSPNPPVGCVVLSEDNRLLATGFHRRFGGPHAEVEAVNSLSDPSVLKGAKIIVTLEPCSHFGKTPPCAEFLAQFPIAEVHYGLKDPNPKVSGRGLQVLEDAGIKTEMAPASFAAELEVLVETFVCNQKFNEPFVGVKVATSLDGMMCLKNRESQWITGAEAREQGHRLRAHYGSVLTSANSLVNDNSRLNSRIEPFKDKSIPVFLLDQNAKSADFLEDSELLKVRDKKDLFVFTKSENLKRFSGLPSSHVIGLSCSEEGFDLREILRKIRDLGMHSLLIEAGPVLTSAMISQGLFHRLEVFIGSKIIGSNPTGSWTKGLNFSQMSDVLEFHPSKIMTLGRDFYLSGRNPKSFSPLFNQA